MFYDKETGKKKVAKEGCCIHCDKPSRHVSLGIQFCTECIQALGNDKDIGNRTVWDK
ncbi:hypothetical protein P4H61_18925 [Paenibacillus peoriae]|uniref:hypothetical protein n=1 Tax=Paenibacillus peoriae TaxID=59893 RepID=UPI0002DEA065|nr:hypothetical protein [Paenibacillus peoriae]MEC0183568.1 hypothetical protein [Paenibacillus peoriae]